MNGFCWYHRGKTEPVSNFHAVRVYDEELRELVDNAVQKKTSIRLFGRLEAIKELDIEQKQRSAAFIRATTILTVDLRERVPDEIDSSPSDGENASDEQKFAKE